MMLSKTETYIRDRLRKLERPDVRDPNSRYSTTTSATRVADRLYITGLNTDAIGVLKLQ